MIVSAATRDKLVRLNDDLLREFPDLPAEQIDGVVQRTISDLLEHARFDDFVPLLAHRGAREHLSRLPHLPTP